MQLASAACSNYSDTGNTRAMVSFGIVVCDYVVERTDNNHCWRWLLSATNDMTLQVCYDAIYCQAHVHRLSGWGWGCKHGLPRQSVLDDPSATAYFSPFFPFCCFLSVGKVFYTTKRW